MVFLEECSFLGGKVPLLGFSFSTDYGVRNSEAKHRRLGSELGPQVVEEPFYFCFKVHFKLVFYYSVLTMSFKDKKKNKAGGGGF